MCEKYFNEQISNNTIRAQLKVVPIEKKIREYKLRWIKHVQRRT